MMLVPTTVWRCSFEQYSYEQGRLFAVTAGDRGWKAIDLDTGLPSKSVGKESRKWMVVGSQPVEVVYQSARETLALTQPVNGHPALIAFDGAGRVTKSGIVKSLRWGSTLIGNPEVGPAGFASTNGGPQGDYNHYASVVLPDLKELPVTFFSCEDAGPQGALVIGVNPHGGTPNFNAPDQRLQCLDPKTGKRRWVATQVAHARFWGKVVLVWKTNGKLALLNALNGRLLRRQLSLPKSDQVLGVVGGDLLVNHGVGQQHELERLHFRSPL